MFYNEKIFKRCFWHKGKRWYRNIKSIPLYFKLIHHLIKHGYDEYATWETFNWFIDTMKAILITYRNQHNGYPVASINDDEEKQKQFNIEYDATIDRMIALLDDMDECNPKYDSDKYKKDLSKKDKEMYAAKDEFFKLFSEYFYCLWD